MPNRDLAWPAGTPNWKDIGYPDLEPARAFYSALFGWDVEADADYATCRISGRAVAALARGNGEFTNSAWQTSFAVTDVDAATEAVRNGGGRVIVDPVDVPTRGRAAFFVDPEGVEFGVWQAAGFIGFEVTDLPGTVAWNDLLTRNIEAAKAFYSSVFGFTYEARSDDYALVKRPGDGEVVAGMHAAHHLREDAPASWLTHFEVVNRDETRAHAEKLGGKTLMSFDSPGGLEALIQAPTGEVFAVLQPHPKV